jgi:hypothetical protein
MTDPRLGRVTEDKVEHPAQTISGRPYQPPAAATLDLGQGFFVVLDAFQRPDEKVIDALKLKISSTKGGDSESTEKPHK